MSNQLTRDDLLSLEQYSKERKKFRARLMEYKKHRTVHLGNHVTLYFEDRLTIQYQIQEMLRVEKIFEEEGIREELNSYNPLIPDGGNLKATLMIEYPDVEERKRQLAKLIGIEDKVWVQVDGFEPVYPVADEDLERDTEDKTSSVHFLRFEFNDDMRKSIADGAKLAAGIEHPNYKETLDPLPRDIRDALVADFK
ncbi:MAG: hypothetical protein MAG794_01442 [Gammaproteobacteria bacterium]|nr:hypothetical protein [Gammaproteobacteria bacterium]